MAERLRVRLTPRGGRDAIDGWETDAEGRPYLKARVSAAPTDGEANEALLKLLAKALGVAKSKLALVAGHTARIKTVEVEGLDAAAVTAQLGGPPAAP